MYEGGLKKNVNILQSQTVHSKTKGGRKGFGLVLKASGKMLASFIGYLGLILGFSSQLQFFANKEPGKR